MSAECTVFVQRLANDSANVKQKQGRERGFPGGLVVKNPPAMHEPQEIRKSLWRRAWQPTPVLLPRKSGGQRSLAGHSP